MSSNSVGVMQGRLSPKVGDRIQAFPWDTWQQEFDRAAGLGFDEIEFIFEDGDFENSPLWTSGGLREIAQKVDATSVNVNYVCADYFMEKPFIRVPEEARRDSVNVLRELIKKCASIGIACIEIPMVDNSRLETNAEIDIFIKCLEECLPVAEDCNIRLGLETSLAPDDFRDLIVRIGHSLIEANYDTGNSASLGYNPGEEISRLGRWINNVHIKDRQLGGGTVPLGQGNTDFTGVFQALAGIPYHGSFILQTARGEDDLKVARDYLTFVKEYIKRYLED